MMKVIFFALISLIVYRVYFKVERPASFKDFVERKFYQSYTTIDKCFPKKFIQPKTTEEIIKIVKDAIKTKEVIKIVGSGHSLNSKKNSKFFLTHLLQSRNWNDK